MAESDLLGCKSFICSYIKLTVHLATPSNKISVKK